MAGVLVESDDAPGFIDSALVLKDVSSCVEDDEEPAENRVGCVLPVRIDDDIQHRFDQVLSLITDLRSDCTNDIKIQIPQRRARGCIPRTHHTEQTRRCRASDL